VPDMTLSDWAAQLCDELSRQMTQGIESRPAEDRWFHVSLGPYGLLVMDEDETEVILWLLDAEGRTSGPMWFSAMSQQTAAAAAAEVVRVVKSAPLAATFAMWPPARKDTAREDAVNALWARVQERIDRLQRPLQNEAHVRAAIEVVERYIDELARSDEGAAIAEYAGPFKAEAANAIRRRATR
jgi:hypothetical protein